MAAALFALSFVHLRADFPNGSPWNDWCKTTDEGWYTGGAVHQHLLGEWIEPGAFNPAITLPVWPAMAAVWFRVAGFGMVQLRVLTLLLTGLSLIMLYRLLRQGAGPLAAAVGIALLSANPFFYSFTRLAVLEPAMIFFLLLALTVADLAARRRSAGLLFATGLLLTLLVLTKTTGIVLAPGILYFLWAHMRRRGDSHAACARGLAITAGAALLTWSAYFALVIRRHLSDYHLLFRINQDRVHPRIVPEVSWHALHDGAWIQPVLYPLAIVLVIAAVMWLRELWREPLFGAAVLIAAGNLTFITYHINLQPRYYLLLMPSLVIVLALTLHRLSLRAQTDGSGAGAVLVVYSLVLALSLVAMAWRTVRYAAHPQYTYLAAANSVLRIISADPRARRMVVGNQGDTLSLWTGIPAICSEYTAEPAGAVLKRFAPGWYIEILGGKTDATRQQLQSHYRLEERGRFEVFDDPQRHTLALYRIWPRQ